MTSAAPEKPVLTFNDKTYDLEALPNEVKLVLSTLQTAESQMQAAQQSYNLAAAGRDSLIKQLEEQIKDIAPLESAN